MSRHANSSPRRSLERTPTTAHRLQGSGNMPAGASLVSFIRLLRIRSSYCA
jgi:hypothetical protein